MTILPSNIRLLESERMADTADGGGRRTNRVIPDGVAGNIFPKVSRIDSVYGRFNLRKIYPHINTASLDVYAGAHFVITDAPDNPRISVLAFNTANDFDTRTAARDFIESYVIAGPESRMVLYGRQLKGSQAIMVYQRVDEPLPEIGEVYSISTEVGGVTTAQQFVRVQDVLHEVRTITDDGGEFQRRIITLKIGARLRYEFQGLASPSRLTSAVTTVPGKMRITTVADAARYYGILPLKLAASAGDLQLTLESVYAPIVPTTQREAAINLASIVGASALLPAATAVTPWATMYATTTPKVGTVVIRLGRAAARGQVFFRVGREGEFWSPTVSTSTAGVVGSAGVPSQSLDILGGAVDFEAGTATLNVDMGNGSGGQVQVSYLPAVEVQQAAHTKSIPITLATRGTVYSVPLLPIPAPGTLMVDYRSLGKWYRLRDDGNGELVGGDAAYGTGSVDYITGGATATLGALPDVGSSVLLSWGSPVHYELITTASVGKARQTFALPDLPVKPGSVSIPFTAGGTTLTVTDSGGVLSGGGVTGTVDYTTGQCVLEYGGKVPNAGSSITITYTQLVPAVPGTPTVVSESHTLTGGSIDTARSWAAGSVVLYVSIVGPSGQAAIVQLKDDGTGVLRTYRRETAASWLLGSSVVVANINYTTGLIEFVADVPAYVPVYNATYDTPWNDQLTYHAPTDGQTVQVSGTTGAASTDVAKTVTLSVSDDAPLQLDMTSNTNRLVIAGSVMFDFAGKTYIDRNGTLLTDVSHTTGSGLEAGAINYANGLITLSEWTAGADAALTMRAGLLVRGRWTADTVSFRTAGSPLRPASLFVQCTAADGELLASTTDQNGVITGPSTTGQAEQTMGVVNVTFAKPVLPDTLRYSTVVLSNLPLDADLLGLDPVRLPSDGKVPICRPADVDVLHHTGVYNAGTPVAGSTINVGRTGLGTLWLEDVNRKKLDPALYVADLDAGTATMAADLSLVGYTPPIKAYHRIEETVLLSDVQINGVVSLTAPLLRDFPLGSLLSGALLYGDLQARVTNVFDHQTWTGVWQGTVIGSGATAQYNDIDYPIEVLNNGAVTERWRIHFLTTTSLQVIGENLGVIATGTTGADLQPINPLTGLPYWTLRAAGWGSGWAAGNQLRFDTVAAAPPTWLARTVLPGAALTGDSFDAQLRGDVD